MKRFKTINDAVYFIETQKRFTAKRDLNKFKKAFDLLELNFEKTKLIHVGGTNGKGSTTAFISNVTVGNNLKTGTFTSPYLVDFNERIKVNNKNISDEDLLDLINFFYDFNIKNELNLSFFELVTLMAFKHFHNLNCEVVIMEIGIGGRLDATNIINYDLTIITSVGYDHLKVLGNTILEIATEKVHALKENGHLISYDDTRYNELFNERAKETNSTIKLINKDLIKIGEDYNFSYKNCTFKLDLLGIYQMQNAVLAYEGIKYLFDFNDDKIIPFINKTTWPARLEKISNNIYLDGAHNIDAIKALIESINYLFPKRNIHIIFSALGDKDIDSMLSLLTKEHYQITLTSFEDIRFKSLKEYETEEIKYILDSKALIKTLKDSKNDDLIVITGSLHFVGYVKKIFERI